MYFITGNHEQKSQYGRLAVDFMKSQQATLLDQQSVKLVLDQHFIWLSGVGADMAEIETHIKDMKAPDHHFQILLCHYPHLIDHYVRAQYDLVLSGHAHGGHWRIGAQGLFAPDQGFIPTYTKGLYQKEKTSMIVSAGLGNSLMPLRLNNYPNLVLITLQTSKQGL